MEDRAARGKAVQVGCIGPGEIVIEVPPIPPAMGIHTDDSQRAPGPQQPPGFGDKDAWRIKVVKSVDAKDEVKHGVRKRQVTSVPARQKERLLLLPGLP